MCIDSIEPPSKAAQIQVNVLRILAALQLVLGVLQLTSDSYFVKHAIFGIFLAVVLFLAQKLLSYQIILMNLIMSIYFCLEFLFACLTYFQNSVDLP